MDHVCPFLERRVFGTADCLEPSARGEFRMPLVGSRVAWHSQAPLPAVIWSPSGVNEEEHVRRLSRARARNRMRRLLRRHALFAVASVVGMFAIGQAVELRSHAWALIAVAWTVPLAVHWAIVEFLTSRSQLWPRADDNVPQLRINPPANRA
jgi:hypothetical protein